MKLFVIQNKTNRGLFWSRDCGDWCELSFASTFDPEEADEIQHDLPPDGELINLPG
jgi:hypothetical protein